MRNQKHQTSDKCKIARTEIQNGEREWFRCDLSLGIWICFGFEISCLDLWARPEHGLADHFVVPAVDLPDHAGVDVVAFGLQHLRRAALAVPIHVDQMVDARGEPILQRLFAQPDPNFGRRLGRIRLSGRITHGAEGETTNPKHQISSKFFEIPRTEIRNGTR
jgi:hypothetical protein